MAETSTLPTRDRLIVAAGELFGEKGFHATTTREICARARANVASIHYHFQDKSGLIEEVLVFVFNHGFKHYRIEEAADPAWPARRQLEEFVRLFLWSRLDPARPDWHRKVVHQEMLNPGPALNAVVDRVIRHHSRILKGIVKALLDDRMPDQAVDRCMSSIIGQCLHFVHHQRISAHLSEHLRFSSGSINDLARHITAFSLAALKNYPAEQDASLPTSAEETEET